MTLIPLPHIQQFRDRHGSMRYYYRRGHIRVRLPGDPGDAEFIAAYHAAVAAYGRQKKQRPSEPAQGSGDAIAMAYYRSPQFSSLKPASQTNYRRLIDRWRKSHGTKPFAHLQRRHVIQHLAERYSEAGPEGANNLRKVLKILCKFAMDGDWRSDDPTLGIKKYKSHGAGFEPWSEGDITQFQKYWSPGTRESLALCLLLYLGQRRGDTVRMGRQHRTGDTIRVTQSKTGTQLIIPLHHELRAVLDELPRGNLTFLTTAYGKPFTAAGFGNWFRDACDKAGLKKRSAHGLRKAAARRLAEVGCTTHQIASITGHKSLNEVERYTASADQERMARQAINRLSGKSED